MNAEPEQYNSIQAVADELGVSESIAWSMERRKMFDRPESKGIARPYVIPDWLRKARDTALPADRLPALFVRMNPNMRADEEPFINHLHEHHSTMRYLMTERAENMRFTLPIKVSEETVAKAQGLPVLFVYSQIVRFGGILLGQADSTDLGRILAVRPFAPNDPMLNTYLPNTIPGGETRLLFASDLVQKSVGFQAESDRTHHTEIGDIMTDQYIGINSLVIHRELVNAGVSFILARKIKHAASDCARERWTGPTEDKSATPSVIDKAFVSELHKVAGLIGRCRRFITADKDSNAVEHTDLREAINAAEESDNHSILLIVEDAEDNRGEVRLLLSLDQDIEVRRRGRG